MTIGPHIRLCVSVAELPEPYVPSEQRTCCICRQAVWYDPKASIDPANEAIVCGECFGMVAAAGGGA